MSSTIAYVMSRFPKISETFVLYEMKALQELGASVEVFPLLRGPAGPRHPEAIPFERAAHFMPLLSPSVVAANVRAFWRAPNVYLGTWWEALSGTMGSSKFFLGALVYFPKCVAFAERMRALGVSHVHAHFANHPALAALIVNRLAGIPFSFTAHGSDLHVDRRMLPQKVAAASFVVAVSEYNRALILEEAGDEHREKVVVIHCGVDPAVFAPESTGPAPAQELGAPLGLRPLCIVCVASLEEVKGHRFLLTACRSLADRGVPFICHLVGDGPLRAKIEARIERLGLASTVLVHGALPRPDVRRMLRTADVSVLASHPTRSGKREGIPVALMEAMACGLPVVASSLSGIPELVDDGRTGFLVSPGDADAIAERLECLAGAPALRARMGRAAREKVGSSFDLRVGARLLYHHVVFARSRRDVATIDAPGRQEQLPPRSMRSSTTKSRIVEVTRE